MSDDLYKRIYNSLSLRETDELVEIWQTNDRFEWTETAFEVIREILQERLGELPAQNEPVWEHISDESDDSDEEVLEKLIDEDNLPVFYQPREMLWLETWLNRAAIASVAAIFLTNLLQLDSWHQVVSWYLYANVEGGIIAWLGALVLFASVVGLQGAIYYFGFKALGSILRILMEMEFNSRGARRL